MREIKIPTDPLHYLTGYLFLNFLPAQCDCSSFVVGSHVFQGSFVSLHMVQKNLSSVLMCACTYALCDRGHLLYGDESVLKFLVIVCR